MRGPEKGPTGRNVAPANLIIDNLELRSCELSFCPHRTRIHSKIVELRKT